MANEHPKRDPEELELVLRQQDMELMQKRLMLKQVILDRKRAEQTVKAKAQQEQAVRESIQKLQAQVKELEGTLGINVTDEA